ncbi:hypothetical protein GMJAKD_14405 [Candidatus Electrothrix aarhusensis]
MQLVLQAKMVPRATRVQPGIKDRPDQLATLVPRALMVRLGIKDHKESLDRPETKVLLAIRE